MRKRLSWMPSKHYQKIKQNNNHSNSWQHIWIVNLPKNLLMSHKWLINISAHWKIDSKWTKISDNITNMIFIVHFISSIYINHRHLSFNLTFFRSECVLMAYYIVILLNFDGFARIFWLFDWLKPLFWGVIALGTIL